MTSKNNKKINPAAKTGWISHKRGYEMTQAPSIIKNIINYLIKERVAVTLYDKNYQSGTTIVFDVKDNKLLVDKPRDWIGIKRIRVVFKDAASLWNHFVTFVVSESKDTLFLRMPTELFMLQRRAHFRVEAPRDSLVTFRYNQKKCKLKIRDVSAAGMLMFEKKGNVPPLHGKEISEILISIPVMTKGPDMKLSKIRFTIPQGKVVRSVLDNDTDTEFFGVHFKAEGKEEARILQYVRQRELHLLRKGL